MAKSNYYQYIVTATNEKTKEESVVCKVRSLGDVHNIVSGLQEKVKSSPIKYGYKKI